MRPTSNIQHPTSVFVMAGGGTGGHVLPLIAVAEELRRRGHEILFIGTKSGIEARLVPAKGFPIQYIEIGGLKRVGWRQTLQTLWKLPLTTLRVSRSLTAKAVFSIGGHDAE